MISLKYQDGTPMTDHLNIFQGIINQLAGMNIKFEEEVQGLWLLGTLSDLWETFRTFLSNSALDGIMNMDLVKSCVMNEDMRRKSQGSSSQSDILVTEKRGRSKSRVLSPIEERYETRKVKDKKNDNDGEDDQVATTTSDFLIVYDSDVVNFACQETRWVIDSGALIHATPRKDFFTSYTSGDFGSVRMGNDGSAKAIGMGDVRLETSNGTKLILKNVKHIPDIRMNLISTGKLDDEGFYNTFRDMDDDSTVELWHNRLGHMSEKDLMILAKKNLLSGMKKGYLKKCAHCLAGKQTRVTFKTHRHTRKPDDHSRKILVYTLKTKGQVLEVFKQFHAFVDRQSGEKLKCIRTDNGDEYSEFDVPDSIWSNNKIFYDHLRVFGCKTFVHIPKDERSKLDAKSRPCVFIGYGQDELGYRFMIQCRKSFDNLIDFDPVPLTHLPTWVEDEAHDDQPDIGDVETPTQVEMDDDVHEQSPVVEALLDIPLKSYEEAMGDENKIKWVDAMQNEMKSLHENHSYELVKLPKGKRALKNRWVYRVKQKEHTLQPRYKVRLVVKGFSQKKGIDFDEIFSPVVKMSSIRVVLGLTASLDLEIEQMDVKTAFLHGDLDKEIYMEQPEGCIIKRKEDYVCKLKKSLYGLKQAPRQWYKKFESIMREQDYRKTTFDHCVFVQKFSDDDFVILLLYVDDILIVGKNVSRIDKLKKQLSKSFSMKDLGPVLERFNMSKAKVVSSPLASHFKLSSRHSPSIDKEKEDMRRVISGSQESNTSNGLQIGAEMKKLCPFEDNCTKLEGHFEMISKFNL
ncbi:Retrovirus-related Pol polyprotein from transposon TNT 1-94 [Vitis vinifera]|uniref:Retrovirus-related Pol polyprotein from transposon TNT 1-94 n=1 Tax=Vitis vinifera TaxID=29760 RepID=A0A438J8F0_VITVI|nr:Retrovirus-related Pol polyprotein from transposon TNT 1-94 [Vitis vinifera]